MACGLVKNPSKLLGSLCILNDGRAECWLLPRFWGPKKCPRTLLQHWPGLAELFRLGRPTLSFGGQPNPNIRWFANIGSVDQYFRFAAPQHYFSAAVQIFFPATDSCFA